MSSIAWGQTCVKVDMTNWERPQFEQPFLIRNGIRNIRMTQYEELPGDRQRQLTSTLLEFDRRGNLVSHIQISNEDTSLIQRYQYTDNGVLRSTYTADKVWNRTYRSGYRFTGNQTMFQVKSYEVLRNDERMLLDTRQYVYDADSALVAIRSFENGQLIREQRYTHDTQGRIRSEALVNAQQDTIQTVYYTYDKAGNITEITQQARETRTFRYAYDIQNRLVQVEWREADQKRGEVTYRYDDQGKLTQMERRIAAERYAGPAQVREVFEYTTF
ncbi:MAG: hypothetical protein OHK0039_12200 [Bacteroidia bacterium]